MYIIYDGQKKCINGNVSFSQLLYKNSLNAVILWMQGGILHLVSINIQHFQFPRFNKFSVILEEVLKSIMQIAATFNSSLFDAYSALINSSQNLSWLMAPKDTSKHGLNNFSFLSSDFHLNLKTFISGDIFMQISTQNQILRMQIFTQNQILSLLDSTSITEFMGHHQDTQNLQTKPNGMDSEERKIYFC